MTGPVHLPSHLHVADGQDGMAYVLDGHSGRWMVLNSTAARLWRTVVEAGDVETGVDLLAESFPPTTVDRFRSDAHDVVNQMFANRLLATGPGGQPGWTAAKGRTSGVVQATARTSAATAVLAGWSLLMALLLLRLPFRYTLRVVGVLAEKWCTRPASCAEALSAVASVESAADRYPGRAACLERSLGAVFAAGVRRRRMSWVMGVAENPNRFHAWVEFDGKVVTRSTHSQPPFIRVLRV
ncbi:lasso peptide biosynthesis B2 protein [Nocardia sp. NRRL S-836]|uniref:lasso peptide biosynthesis B2 protein n=1 Tax=Nocardia sp. NRRL S-836 TaxID=1519492 RepID=UPI0006AF6260|nr:lasso peptide biosynthesis B2 protein [Nocardia sp. NRRL S-836]